MKAPQNKSAAEKPEIGLPDEEKQRLIRQCQKDSASSGRTQYQRFLNGERLTYREAVLAKCYECAGGYSDGRYDCELPACPIYQFMPYKGKLSPYSSQQEMGGMSHEQ